MARSILRKSRSAKHERLFELIRQGNLAEAAARRPASVASSTDLQALRQQAEQSVKP